MGTQEGWIMAAKKKVTKKKVAKKATRKTAKKTAKKTTKKTAKKAPAKAAGGGGDEAQALEQRMMGPLADLEKIVGQFRRMPFGGFDLSRFGPLPSLFEGRTEARFPSMDIVNREKEIVVRAQVPGFDKEDIDVSLTDRTLKISGESHHEEETEEGDLHRHEIRKGSFSRVVTLPEDVDGRKAKASFKDGMLELILPKSRAAKKHSVPLE
jgi:HSP20 family protein